MKKRLSPVVSVNPDGSYLLACGHVVHRTHRVSKVICEHCNPEAFAIASRNGAKQWPKP